MVEVTPAEAVLGSGAGGPLTAPSPWIQYQGWIQYPAGVVIGNPAGGQQGLGTLNLQAIYINGVIVNLAQYVQLVGSTMTGFLTLSGDPVNALHAVTKQYVDARVTTINGTFANYLPLAGGTMTGAIVLPADPTTNLQAATKQYVDNKMSGIIGIPDAPVDGNIYGRKSSAWVESDQIDVGTY